MLYKDNKQFIPNSSSMNELVLQNLIKDMKISSYEGSLWQNGVINYKMNNESGFDYEKYYIHIFIVRLRKIQNYDWSDEYYNKGEEMVETNNIEKALDYFKEAEKLDNLNKEIYIRKGLCYIKLVFITLFNVSVTMKKLKRNLKIVLKLNQMMQLQ
jgi:tetratricopeptide (TPR) repeat protein